MKHSDKRLIFSLLFFLIPTVATAKSELVQKLVDTKLNAPEECVFTAELHYDKEKKKADLWFNYRSADRRTVFTATSLPERLKDASHKLVAQPVSKLYGTSVLIFNSFENNEKGYFDGDRGLALLVHLPVEELSQAMLDDLLKRYPNAFIKDAAGNPRFAKAILSRLTASQVYPLAVFDSELVL